MLPLVAEVALREVWRLGDELCCSTDAVEERAGGVDGRLPGPVSASSAEPFVIRPVLVWPRLVLRIR